MPAIHLHSLSFSYSSAVEVFSNVSVHLSQGWTGVVGPNGAGKSTLLSLIAGGLSPSAGTLSLDPRGAKLARCRQEVDSVTPEIRTFAEATDGLSRKWLGRLGIASEDVQRWETLSPGERKRFQLAAALASDPNILLLDEPTNHLDEDARQLVEGALVRFDGVGLVISHDRAFLDRLTSRTLRVWGRTLHLWAAPYSLALKEWTAEESSRLAERDKAQRRKKTLRRRLADERRGGGRREAGFERRAKKANPKDHDARSMAAKGRHESGSASGQRRRTVLRQALERADSKAADLVTDKVFGGEIFFDFEPSPKRRLFHFAGALSAGPKRLFDHLDVVIRREDRVRVAGPNGAGKSTLLKALIRNSGVPPDRLLYLPQELTREEGTELLSVLDALPKERRGRVLSVVAALGVDPDGLLASDRPSPGEGRKLALALGLGGGSWVMVLDEPTNHLDLPAVERLESALEAYPGALLLVTHDETFGARTTKMTWTLGAGHLSVSRNDLGVGTDPASG